MKYYIHGQTQSLPHDSLANSTMFICNIISIYIMVTIIIMPDATAYQNTAIFAISYISATYHLAITMAGIYDILRVPEVALVDAPI